MWPPAILSPRQNSRLEWPKPSDIPVEKCTLSSVRYELSKLRAKGLVEKLPHSRRYQLLPTGYRICLLFLKLLTRSTRPLPQASSIRIVEIELMSEERLTQLDKLYRSVTAALDQLVAAVGLKIVA